MKIYSPKDSYLQYRISGSDVLFQNIKMENCHWMTSAFTVDHFLQAIKDKNNWIEITNGPKKPKVYQHGM